MKTAFTKSGVFYALIFYLLLYLPSQAFAQTPGLITKPASNGGQAILDPNRDGYVSKTTSGFTGKNDEGAAYSEIPYRPFPAMGNEVIGDLNTGTIGGHTDFVPSQYANSTGSPAASYFDGKHMMFRMRLGSQSSASKGYSVLIDTDNTFNGGYPNPGFEYEVVFATNFAVQVIKHSATGSQTLFSGSTDQYSQISVAASTNSNNPDYFYDFYVPLTAFAGGITTSTPLRMSAVTISSAQSGLSGSISDIAGVDDRLYGNDPFKAWPDIINAFPPTSLQDIQEGEFKRVTASPPVVNDPIYTTSTIITGTSIEASGSLITVFRNGIQMCGGTGQPTCPTVNTNGTWSLLNVTSGTLQVGNKITATVSPANKNTSGLSNEVIVVQGACFTVVPPVITGIYNPSGTGLKGISGTSTFNGPQTINIYHSSNTSVVYYTIEFTPASGATSPYTWNLLFDSNNKTLTAGLYTATITPKGGCESQPSNQICYKSGNSGTLNDYKPTITHITLKDNTVIKAEETTTTFVPTQLKLISGTLPSYTSGITIEVVLNGIHRTITPTPVPPSSTAPYNWTVDISSLTIEIGDLITVRSKISSSECASILSSASNYLVAQPETKAPFINTGPYCGIIKTLSGTSSEQAGTVIEIYANGVATGRTGTVTISGVWAVDLSSLSGGGIAPGVQITARAKAIDKLLSPVSNTVSSTPVPSGTVTINPVTEGQTVITGTAPASTATSQNFVTVTVDGTSYPEVAVDVNGLWKVSNIAYYDVYPGASVTASYRTPGVSCPSTPVSISVTCKKPLKYTIGTSDEAICSGETVQVTLSSSETDVYYTLMNGSATTGNTVMGTGGPITLTSGALYTSTILTVTGTKINGSGCSELMNGSKNVTVNPLPSSAGLAFSPSEITSSCPGTFSAILTGTSSAYTYQLEDAAGDLVGTALPGTGSSSFALSTGYVSRTQTFKVRVSDRNSGCTIISASPTFTVTINGPLLTPSVTADNVTVCINQTATITLGTTQSGYTYQLFRSSDNSPASDAITGNGSSQSITSYPLTTEGTHTYYVAVRATAGTCTEAFRLDNQVTIQVMGNAISTSSASWDVACGDNLSVTLSGNTPPAGGTGVWQLTSRINSTANITIDSPNASTTTASGLKSGTYIFTWTITSTCNSTTTNSSSVTVTVNCPGIYEVAPAKFVDQYSLDEVLATANDIDGGVKSATLVPGDYLPAGTALNTTTGDITVINPDALLPGIYTVDIEVMDNHGFPTIIPVTLRFQGVTTAVSPLAVTLKSFSVAVQDGRPFLTWATASEKDNSHFVVERSANGFTFSAVGKVEGKNTASASYTFTDQNPLLGTAYYRLKQVDIDDRYAYSKMVNLLLKGGSAMEAIPNPFTDRITITVPATASETIQVNILTISGSLLYNSSILAEGDLCTIELQLSNLSKGVYILKAISSKGQHLQRIVKQ